MKQLSILLISIILFFLVNSCKKKDTSYDLNPNVNSSNNVILSFSSYTTVFNLLIKARLDTSLAKHGYAMIDSAFTMYDSVNMEYDFYFRSAISPDSIQRSGQIAVFVSGDILQKGSYAKAVFQSYCQDLGKVDGIDSISNEGVNAFSQVVFSDNISHGSINEVLSGGTLTVDINSTYRALSSSLVSGKDILFLLQGNISGLSSKGHTFSGSIRDTLQDSFSCPWIKGGIIDVHVSDAEIPDGYIDFVNSDGCSDVIWYYFNGSEFKIRMNKFYLRN
jgi:hypothetical protein